MSTCNVFCVYGCYGTLTVDVGTGKVIRYDPDSHEVPEYEDIAQIDISTYETTFGLQIIPGDHISIMDLGFWSRDGRYFELDYPKIQSDYGNSDLPQSVIVLSGVVTNGLAN